MGLRANGRWIAAGLLLAGQSAQAECPPDVAARSAESVVERIDGYWSDPRGAATWRAQAGLGDPGVAGDAHDERYWDVTDQQQSLIDALFPGGRPEGARFWYPNTGACRLSYALATAEARVAQLGRDHAYVAQWLRAQRTVFSACADRDPWETDAQAARRPVPPIALPAAMATSDPAVARLQQADRAYQSASILFYRRDPGAARAFRAIAASASPHAPTARYMLVAIQARGLDSGGFDQPPEAAARRAERARATLAEARAILADPRLAEVHPMTQGLIGFLGYHTGDDRVRAAQVEATLDALEAPIARLRSDEVARDRYARAVSDVAWLRRSVPDEGYSPGYPDSDEPPRSGIVRALAARAAQDPFAEWLLVGVSPFEREPWIRNRHAYELAGFELRARERMAGESGRAWAVVAASLASSYNPEGWNQLDALAQETRTCPSDDRVAAVAPLLYHQTRAALMFVPLDLGGGPVTRQQGFDAALARVEAWPWQTSLHHRTLVSDMLQYLIAQGRLEDARRLRDRTDPRGERQPTDLAPLIGINEANAPALLLLAEDEDHFVREVRAMPNAAQPLLNLLAIPALTRLAGREDLPQPVRARFARVAWTRLYALRRRIPRPLDVLMRSLNPEVTASWTSRPGARPDNRALLLDVLRSPALNILLTNHQRGSGESVGYADPPAFTQLDLFEHSDNNWWCAWQLDRHRLTPSAILYRAFFAGEGDWDPMAAAGSPAALGPLLRSSWLWRQQDPAEQEALATIPSAPQTLAEGAVAWRGGGPRQGQDEALALAVRATRYGCQRQGGHAAWSRAAFTTLHRLYPTSEAAQRTRFWFDCSHFSGGCARRSDDEPDWERWARWRYYY